MSVRPTHTCVQQHAVRVPNTCNGRKRDLHSSIYILQVTAHAPPLPIPYGTHHSKFFILKYATGIRVCIHTANLVFCDCNNKTQALFYQDFPFNDTTTPLRSNLALHPPSATGSASGRAAANVAASELTGGGDDFMASLLLYLHKLALPEPVHVEIETAIRAADFSSTRVALVSSAPGRHTGLALSAYGHMRVRKILGRNGFPGRFRNTRLALQFSSLGSLSHGWIEGEFGGSLSAGRVLAEGALPRVSISLIMRTQHGTSKLCACTIEIHEMRLHDAALQFLYGRYEGVALNAGKAAVQIRPKEWPGMFLGSTLQDILCDW